VRHSINKIFVFIAVLAIAGAVCGRAAPADKKESVLYIFAHQDDEIFIIGRMASDARSGREVHAVWVTDGSGTADAAAREKESRASMKLAGIPQENLHFLGYQDRYSWKHLDAAYADIMKIAEALQPVEITTDAYEGGNIDHDVTSLLGSVIAPALASKPVHYEFPLYNTYKGNYRAGKFLPRDESPTLYAKLDDQLANIKIGALDLYPTQMAIINTIKAVTSKKKILKDGEIYRVSPKHDYMKKPVDETLGYELNPRNPMTFEDWKKEVGPFLEKHKAAGDGK